MRQEIDREIARLMTRKRRLEATVALVTCPAVCASTACC